MKASVFKLMFFPSTTIFSVSLIRQKADPRQLADRKIICPILSRALRLEEMMINITIQLVSVMLNIRSTIKSSLDEIKQTSKLAQGTINKPNNIDINLIIHSFAILIISKEWNHKWSIKHTDNAITDC